MPGTPCRPKPTTLEQGIAYRPEETSRAEARPVHSSSPRNRTITARSCDLQPSNRQQASRLRLGQLRLDDICLGVKVRHRATIVQKKTGRPVQFEITEQSRSSVEAWLPMLRATGSRYLLPSRLHASPHLSTRQYARLVHRWVESVGLEPASYGTHSMRRTKAAQIYRKTGNLRAVQLLLGHTKLESTVRYLGIEVDDALNMAEQIELYRQPPASRPWSLARQSDLALTRGRHFH
jgi:hypothetical protein